MSKHLQQAIEKLMKRLIALSAKVEESVQLALKALDKRDAGLAKKVVEMDEEIDMEEIDIEEECLKILALHQPVAIDLRFIIAALKINNDLERIGDLAMDIANHVRKILAKPAIEETVDLDSIYQKVRSMLKRSLDAMVNLNAEMANQVLEADDEVDDMNRNLCNELLEKMKETPARSDVLLQYIYISRRMERIADQSTNIAEDVLYMIRGEIVRHGKTL